MKIRLQVLILMMAVGLLFAASASAQDDHRNMPMPKLTPTPKPSPTAAPKPSPTPAEMPMDMPMPSPTPTPTPTAQPMPMDMDMRRNMPMPSPSPPRPVASPTGGGETQTLGNLSPEKDFPEPVADNERFGSTLFDVLEFRPGRGGDSDFRWDIEGWYGTDKNRFWYKSEGERNTAFKADYDIDLQLLYGRLVHPYFDFQVGVRFEF